MALGCCELAGGRIHHRANDQRRQDERPVGVALARRAKRECRAYVGVTLTRILSKFLKKDLASVANILHIRANETALFRLARGISKTIWNITFQNAGFNRRAAVRCRAPCDLEKNLFSGPGDAQTKWHHVFATASWHFLGYRRRDSALRLQPRLCAVAGASNDRDYVSRICRCIRRPGT